ncbi:MAG: type IVB secretion system protein IcmH/DotU [Acidobacteria bacterium]|nr:type IVB secretion system protein IcmH/DotU [Acidobacteriota bacterium]
MQNVVAQSRTKARSENDLINLTTPLLQLVMRIKAGLIAPSDELRRSIDGIIKKMEEQGVKRGYHEQQMQNAKFALAAFVDETVLAGGFPLREEWERYPLQLEYFREALAGTKFFDRLDELLKRVESESDVVEVYYICLLLGFKGKYDVFLEDQLPGVINNVAEHLRRAGRLRASILSPHWLVNDQPEPPPAEPELPRWVKYSAAAAIGLVALLYLILNSSLISRLNDVKESLLK